MCSPRQIVAIRVRAGSNILNPLRYPIAHNELEAKFCPAFMVSAIALRRKAGIHEFTDEFVRSAPVQQMMAKVERVLDPEIEARGFEKIRSTVEVDLDDGRRLVEHADERYRGGPIGPSRATSSTRSSPSARRWCCRPPASTRRFEMVESLETLPDIRDARPHPRSDRAIGAAR